MSPQVPAYRQIADDLRAKIHSGEYGPGAVLPTQAELADRYSVARMTARQALSQLANEGLVTTQQGKGAVVRSRQPVVYRPQAEYDPRISRQMDRFTAALHKEGRKATQTIEVAVENATPLIAGRLGVEPGAPVAVRKRVRSVDGEPLNINDTYYRYVLAADTEIMNPADIPGGSNNILDRKGYNEVRAIDEFFIRMPEPIEIQRLKLTPGTPVACHIVTGLTAKSEAARVDVFILPGDRHVILYERIRPDTADDTSLIEDETP